MTIATKDIMAASGISADLLASDGMLPEQFHEMWSGSQERSAEFKLALAVLEQALEDFDRYRTARTPACQRIYREACKWLLTVDRDWPYSFVNVCEVLDVSFDRIRTHVLACRASDQDAEPLRPSQASGVATPLARNW